MYHNNNYAITWLSHDKSKTCNLIGLREFKTADSAHTRNRAKVTRPFSLAEGWGLGTRLDIYVIHIKCGRQTLRFNGFPVVSFKQQCIKFESKNQKSSLIIFLVLFLHTHIKIIVFFYLNLFFLLCNKGPTH